MRFILLTLLLAAASLPVLAEQVAQAAPPTLQPDACGAVALQSFVGKPKAKLPVNLPKGARILCDTCVATMDYSAGRLNVIYDSKTERVTQIRCG